MSAHLDKNQNGSPVTAKKATSLSILGVEFGTMSKKVRTYILKGRREKRRLRVAQLKYNAANVGFVECEIPVVARRIAGDV